MLLGSDALGNFVVIIDGIFAEIDISTILVTSGVTRSIERIREIPEYSGTYVFPVISWEKSQKNN